MKALLLSLTTFSFCLFALVGCSTVPTAKTKPNAVSIMAYNVENLFDTLPDKDREDFTFLPLSYKKNNKEHKLACEQMSNAYYRQECLDTDWNEQILDLKLKRVSDTILQINGEGPDVLMLEEVENLNSLNMLADRMPEAKYQTRVLIEGDDRRGIDVAVLSRFPLAGEAKLHRIEFTPDTKDPKWKKPMTRGILEVPVKLPTGEKLTVLALHFPSQGAPTQQRIDSINSLNKIIEGLGPDALVVAGGDSNVTTAEDFKDGLQSKMMGSRWLLAHKIGCQSCKGSHYYRGDWSFLDVLLFSKNMSPTGFPDFTGKLGKYQVLPESIRVPQAGKYQMQLDGTTARFNEYGSVGVSDHLPIYGEIEVRP